MVVEGYKWLLYLVMIQKLAGMPGVLAGDQVCGAEGFKTPQGNVCQVSYGRGNKGDQRRGRHVGHVEPIKEVGGDRKGRKDCGLFMMNSLSRFLPFVGCDLLKSF